ncbi:MAG TPA: hypothetical protein VIQ54_29555 [Polyangia bacterium]
MIDMAVTDPTPQASLMERLDQIRRRPNMYLGVGPPSYGTMLDRLETWIVGYSEAVRAHRITDVGVEFYERFWMFLERELGRSLSQGTIPTIRLLSVNDEEAWDAYWRLLDDFRRTGGG